MRISRSILPGVLVGLWTPSLVVAETTIYFKGSAVEVPPPLVLLVGGLALLAVGTALRKWLRGRTPAPEPGSADDVSYPLPGQPAVGKIPLLPDADLTAVRSGEPSAAGPDVRRPPHE